MRPRSEDGYSVSRFNRLTHGVMIHDVLPSLGERCPYRYTCPVVEDAETLSLCRPGYPCPWEAYFLDEYVPSARQTYTECLNWLTSEERDLVLNDLAILSLRKIRLSALIAREGFLRDKVHPISGIVYGKQSALGIGRYATAIENRFQPLMNLLLCDPEATPQEVGEAISDPTHHGATT